MQKMWFWRMNLKIRNLLWKSSRDAEEWLLVITYFKWNNQEEIFIKKWVELNSSVHCRTFRGFSAFWNRSAEWTKKAADFKTNRTAGMLERGAIQTVGIDFTTGNDSNGFWAKNNRTSYNPIIWWLGGNAKSGSTRSAASAPTQRVRKKASGKCKPDGGESIPQSHLWHVKRSNPCKACFPTEMGRNKKQCFKKWRKRKRNRWIERDNNMSWKCLSREVARV